MIVCKVCGKSESENGYMMVYSFNDADRSDVCSYDCMLHVHKQVQQRLKTGNTGRRAAIRAAKINREKKQQKC